MFSCNLSAHKLIKCVAAIAIALAMVMMASTLVACNKWDDILHSRECIVEIQNGSSGEIFGKEDPDISRYYIQDSELGKDENIKQYLKQLIFKLTNKNVSNVEYIFDGAYADTLYEIEGFYTVGEKCYWYNITAGADDENTNDLYNILQAACWNKEHGSYISISCEEGSKLPQGSDDEWDYGTVTWCENHQMTNTETRAKMLSYLKEWAHVDAQDVVLFQPWIGASISYQVYAKVNGNWYEGNIPEDRSPLTAEEQAQLTTFSESIHTAYLQSDAFAQALKSNED